MGAMKTAKQERKWYWQAAIGVLIGWLLGQSVIKMENSCKRAKGYSVDYTSEDNIPNGELDGKHLMAINFSFCFNTSFSSWENPPKTTKKKKVPLCCHDVCRQVHRYQSQNCRGNLGKFFENMEQGFWRRRGNFCPE